MREMTVEVEIGDDSFIPFYQMRLVAGSNALGGENIVPVLINETYAHELCYKDPTQACGKLLLYGENHMWVHDCRGGRGLS